MKNGKSIKVVAIFTVVCALVTLSSMFSNTLLKLYLTYKFKRDFRNASTIGIIGGADGPTAVFVSGDISSPWLTAVFALLTILGIVYLSVAKYKKT